MLEQQLLFRPINEMKKKNTKKVKTKSIDDSRDSITSLHSGINSAEILSEDRALHKTVSRNRVKIKKKNTTIIIAMQS